VTLHSLWRDSGYFIRYQIRELFYISFWVALLSLLLAWILKKILPIEVSLAAIRPLPVTWLIHLLLHSMIAPLLNAALLRFLQQRSCGHAITAQQALREGLVYYPALLLLDAITSTVITCGLLLFLLPGLLITVRWSLASCILVSEHCSVRESLEESWQRTANCWLAVLAGYSLVLAIRLTLGGLQAMVSRYLPADLWSWTLILQTLLNLTQGLLLIYCFRLTMQLSAAKRKQSL
jgi:Uncharacterised protein family (UPF0259)